MQTTEKSGQNNSIRVLGVYPAVADYRGTIKGATVTKNSDHLGFPLQQPDGLTLSARMVVVPVALLHPKP